MAEWKGRRLSYPLGVADLEEVGGKAFDAEVFSKVPILIVQGAKDANSSLPAGPGPSDSYSREQAEVAFEVFEKTAPGRPEEVKRAYAAAGARAEFRVYPEVEHRITPEMAGDLVEFMRERVGGR